MVSSIKNKLIQFIRKYTSDSTRRKIVRFASWPPIGWVNFGSLRQNKPIGLDFGARRGTPVDRYYIEKFLLANKEFINGHVLEIGTDMYTKEFGREFVTKSDVLHVAERKNGVTIIGDLTNEATLPDIRFDCILLTQTLQFIFDVPLAIKNIHKLLRPGGCVLATVSGMAQISRYDMDHWGDYWRFTTKSIRKLFEDCFPAENITIEAFGNVKVCIAFLHGIAYEELKKSDLDYFDPDYELLITVKSLKS